MLGVTAAIPSRQLQEKGEGEFHKQHRKQHHGGKAQNMITSPRPSNIWEAYTSRSEAADSISRLRARQSGSFSPCGERGGSKQEENPLQPGKIRGIPKHTQSTRSAATKSRLDGNFAKLTRNDPQLISRCLPDLRCPHKQPQTYLVLSGLHLGQAQGIKQTAKPFSKRELKKNTSGRQLLGSEKAGMSPSSCSPQVRGRGEQSRKLQEKVPISEGCHAAASAEQREPF